MPKNTSNNPNKWNDIYKYNTKLKNKWLIEFHLKYDWKLKLYQKYNWKIKFYPKIIWCVFSGYKLLSVYICCNWQPTN